MTTQQTNPTPRRDGNTPHLWGYFVLALIWFSAGYFGVSAAIYVFQGSDSWFSRFALALIMLGMAQIITELRRIQ